MENYPPEDYASTFQTEDQQLLQQQTDELVGLIPRPPLSTVHIIKCIIAMPQV